MSWRHLIRLVSALLVVFAVAVPAVTVPAGPAAAAPPPPPGQDPFYTYRGPAPLADIPPGTVLKERTVQLAIGTNQTPVTAEQLLYRTKGELGQPTVTVTTVLEPTNGVAVPRVIDYLSFYDALGAQCDPSYTLAGGNPGKANQQQTEVEEALILSYLANGFVVTVPDFEGTDLEWAAGHEAGYGALDAVRATLAYLNLSANTPVGLTGYSGGSIAADWASEVAPRYAPGLHIVGVAEGGIPVDYAHNLDYINGSAGWSGIIPAVLVALSRAYRIGLAPYLSPYGQQLAKQVAHACIGSFYGAYPGLTIQKLLKPRYQHFLRIPTFVRVINHLIMGSAPGHPDVPLFMAVGNSDGTGDGIMVAGDVEGLAHEYCTQGVPVQFAVYKGANHDQAAVHFEPAAMQFLQERFAGVPFTGNCAQVGDGNSLAPLPMPSGAPGGGGLTSAPAPRTRAAADIVGSGSLAYTGLSPVIPVAATLLLLAGLAGLVRLRRGSRA